MGESLEDGMFWLPPRFLADDDEDDYNDDVLVDEKDLFGCNLDSFSNSTVESVISSTETESDEDDYLNGLTRQLSHTTLLDNNSQKHAKAKKVALASPQSTLSPVHGGKAANGQTQDLLFAAAEEVGRMRLPPPPSSTQFHRGAAKRHGYGFYPNQKSGTRQQFEAFKFKQMKQHQLMRQKAARVWAEAQGKKANNKPLGLAPSAWPSLQQAKQLKQQGKQVGDGTGVGDLKDVFAGNGNRERAGTGVFLPRVRVPNEPWKNKSGYSTALVSENVVQLRCNFGDDGSAAAAVHLGGNDTFGATLGGPGAGQKKCKNMRKQPQPVEEKQEVQLPPEWTY